MKKMEKTPQQMLIDKSMNNHHNSKKIIDKIQTSYDPKTQIGDIPHILF